MFILTIVTLMMLLNQIQCRMTAYAVLYGDLSTTGYGIVTFIQDDANSPVRIGGTVSGLNVSSAHGIHIHAYPVSETMPNCNASGPHFNPYNTTHGPRTANITSRHVGDLGNITTDANGKVTLAISDSIIQLYNATQSILNRTIVIHLSRDDGGMGGFTDSHTTGNAGARIVCGLIKSNAMKIKPVLTILWVMIMTIILIK